MTELETQTSQRELRRRLRVLVPETPDAPAFLVALALVVVGAIGALFSDRAPERPVAHRGPYRVLEADFHSHTTWSDGGLSPASLMRQANRRGLDVIALTEHNTVVPSRLARAYAGVFGGPLVITGEEVTTHRFHIIALGIESTVEASSSIARVVDDIHAQHGVAIAAHPVRQYWPALEQVRDRLDGAEIMHPIAYGPRMGWRVEDMRAFRDAGGDLAAIGSSDYHWGSALGLCRTLVFVPQSEPVTPATVVDAVRARRTVTLDLDGTPLGPPELTELLRREPYTPREGDWNYGGEGSLDRVSRTLGWLGLVGVVVFRSRKPRASSSQKANASSR